MRTETLDGWFLGGLNCFGINEAGFGFDCESMSYNLWFTDGKFNRAWLFVQIDCNSGHTSADCMLCTALISRVRHEAKFTTLSGTCVP